MPYYKDVYYADNTEPLSIAQIEYKSAKSIGDKLEELQYDSAIPVTNTAARDVLFPAPVNGDAVWVMEAQKEYEQRYINNAWYRTTSMSNILKPSTVSVSSGGIYKILGNGEVSFAATNYVALNNIFPAFVSPERYSSYKIIVDIVSSTVPSNSIIFQLSTNAATTPLTYNNVRNGWVSGNTSVASSVDTYMMLGFATLTHPTCYSEINIKTMFPGTTTRYIGFETSSSTTGVTATNEIFKSYGHTNVTGNTFDGIRIASNGASKISGTVKVYGIR